MSLVALGVVAVLVAGAVVLTRGDDPALTPVTKAPPAVTQRTLLVMVTGLDDVIQASALTALSEPQPTANVLLVPSGLLVDVAGTGTIPFGETTTLPGESAPAEALTDLVGVRIDDSWTLTRDALAALVDAVGGVQAAVDVDVPVAARKGSRKGNRPRRQDPVVVRAGNQKLGGVAAAAYATFRGEGEPEQARLARFDDVWTAVLAGLPDDSGGIEEIVTRLSGGSESTLDPSDLAAWLGQLHAAVAGDELVSDVLPVTEIDSGGTVPTYGIDSGQVAAVLRSLFPGALQTDRAGEVLRVLVENGVGTPGLVEEAREQLVGAGFRFVNGGNAAEFSNAPSSVIIPDGTEASVRRGQRVAAALGLPQTAIATSDRGQTVADVIVILGSDFTP